MRMFTAALSSKLGSMLATVLLMLLGFLVFYLADPQELSAIDALCLLTTSRTPNPRLTADPDRPNA